MGFRPQYVDIYANINATLIPSDLTVNALHLEEATEADLQACIDEAFVIYIAEFITSVDAAKWYVIHKWLAQHLATLNVRRADSESLGPMSRSISTPNSENLGQTVYGQQARSAGLGMDPTPPWAMSDDTLNQIIIGRQGNGPTKFKIY